MRAAKTLAGLCLLGAMALVPAGCSGPRHQLQRLVNGDGRLVAIVDYQKATFGLTHDAIVSLEEPHGVATSVATFRNVEKIDVTWLAPEDLNICESGQVVGYQTAVKLNTSTGMRTVHIHYNC